MLNTLSSLKIEVIIIIRPRSDLDSFSKCCSSAATTFGHPSCKHHGWFDESDEEIKSLLEIKHHLHKAHQNDTTSEPKKAAYSNICKTVQNRLRDMHKKAEEMQSSADRKDMKKFNDALKTVYDTKSSRATSLLSADGSTLFTNKDK